MQLGGEWETEIRTGLVLPWQGKVMKLKGQGVSPTPDSSLISHPLQGVTSGSHRLLEITAPVLLVGDFWQFGVPWQRSLSLC